MNSPFKSIYLPLICLAVLSCSNADSNKSTSGKESPPSQEQALRLDVDQTSIDRSSVPIINSYAPVLKDAKPAVVAVYTARVVKVVRQNQPRSIEEYMLRRFFGLPSPPRRPLDEDDIVERRIPQGVGSGVIISEDGHILTNNHVVSGERGQDADEVLVQLADGTETSATIVGRDPRTDIAVIKIDGGPYPSIKITDSDLIEVGDIVFAIGNPLGVGNTVTQGIVSATGRAIGIYGEEGYEDFIQTDASINMGNSGGALVDIRGRLVGINSAILSRTGGNIGIGFAIPSNLAVGIATQLVEYGEVRRGYLGVITDDLTPELVEAFGLDSQKGALINKVEPGSPAESAGLEHGDVIMSVDGKPIENTYELRLRIGQLLPGAEIELGIFRDGKRLSRTATLSEQEQVEPVEIIPGIHTIPLNASIREQINLPGEIHGVIISRIDSNSPYRRYLSLGMIIMEVNNNPVSDPEAVVELLKPGTNRLKIFHRGQTGFLQINL